MIRDPAGQLEQLDKQLWRYRLTAECLVRSPAANRLFNVHRDQRAGVGGSD